MTSFRGVAPSVLIGQVRNTAAWALDGDCEGVAHSWRAALRDATAVAQGYDPEGRYLRLLLAAHFCTVGTFVPTDVDSHIRHHAWQRCDDEASLRAYVAVLDEWPLWDVSLVSARVVNAPGVGVFSGHDGEWLAVMAGALGRALSLSCDALSESLIDAIDRSLAAQHRAYETLRDTRGAEVLTLQMANTIAHNLGDLSRVVDEWPTRTPDAVALRQRYSKLGHVDPRFAQAGRVNKAVMSDENHRFLSLRAARSLRVSRSLLLAFGPLMDGWGETIARAPCLDPGTEGDDLGGRGAVVAALVEGHTRLPQCQGYLRALAGIHHAAPGGVDRLLDAVPARSRKLVQAGPVREALQLDARRFEARVMSRYRAALSENS